MTDPTKCPKCGAPMREIHDPSGFVVFRHEVGGRPCLENQLVQARRREGVAYKCLNEIEEVLAMHRMRLHQEADDE
jgi:hypothetical protein